MSQQLDAMRSFFESVVPLSKEAWGDIVRLEHGSEYKRKQVVVRPGQVLDKMIFIHQGAMRLYLIKDGVDITYYFYFPHSFATDFSSFKTGMPTQYFLECIEDCSVSAFNQRDIYFLYDKYPEMQKFGRLMAEEAYLMMDRRMNYFQFYDLETRYLALLREEPHLLQRVPQHLIATYLGVTPESLSRVKQQVARQRK